MFGIEVTAEGGFNLPEDSDFGPDVIVAALATAEPGAQLHAWLELLDPATLSESQLLEVGLAWERQRRRNAAIELALLRRLTQLPVAVPAHLDAEDNRGNLRMGPAAWLAKLEAARLTTYAAITGQSPVTVGRLAAAGALTAPDGPLAATGTALADGRLSLIRARVIADELADIAVLTPDDATAIEAAVLPDAEQLSRGKLERTIAIRKAALGPATEEQQRTEMRAKRCVSRPMPLPAGAASLEVLGPAEDIYLLHTALTATARRTSEAARAALRDAAAHGRPAPEMAGIDAHRFDALINLAAGVLNDPDLPTRHGRRPAIHITMALSTMLGLDDAPADLAGYGPITAEAARRAAQDPTGSLQRLITRPDGLVIDAAYTIYRPPQALCDTVIARDATCTFPRCTRPALECDLDHQTPWPDGDTKYWNLGDLCRSHHLMKTAGAWTPRLDPGTGETIWTHNNTGRTLRRPAERRLPPSAQPQATDLTEPTAALPDGAALPPNDVDMEAEMTEPHPPRILRRLAESLGPYPAAPPPPRPEDNLDPPF